MADPLEFNVQDTEKNLHLQETYLDVTKHIYDIDKKRIELAKKSAKFSRDDMKSITEKHSEMEKMAKDIQRDLVYQSMDRKKMQTVVSQTEGIEKKNVDRAIKQRLSVNQMRLKQLTMEADFMELKAAERIEAENRFGNIAIAIGSKIKGLNLEQLNTAKSINAEFAKFPKLAGMWGKGLTLVVMILLSAYELFLKFDKAAMDFRKSMGVTRPDVADMRKSIEASAISMMNLGVTIDDVYNSTKALGTEMGGIRNVSADLRDNIALVKAQLGVSEETSAKFLRNMAAIAGKTIISQKNTLYMAEGLSAAAGTNLNEVMGDVANASGTTLSLMGKMPNQMLRAAIEARRFNTSINDVARANRTVLDFTTSIQDEMEASVLLGHSINLQKLRQLSFAGDEEAAMKERIRLAEKEDFLNIKNVFQKEAVAKALGTNVESLTKQLQASAEIERIRRKGTPEEKKQLEIYEAKLNATQAQSNLEAERIHREIMSVGNQERIANISNSFNKIMAQIGKVFLPIIDVGLKFIADNMGIILGSATALWVFGGKILSVIRALGEKLFYIGAAKNWKWLEKVGDLMHRFGGSFGRLRGLLGEIFGAGSRVGGMFTRIGGLAKGLGNVLGTVGRIIGRILAPIFFAVNIFKEIKKLLGDKSLMNTQGFWAFNGKLILRAVGVIVRALWQTFQDLFFGLPGLMAKGLGFLADLLPDLITKPFKIAWAWLGKWFLGSSPSTLGMMIVDGIRSIVPMIFDALTSPFKAGWAWIKKHVPGVEWAAKKVTGAAGDNTVQKPIEQRMVGSYIPAAKITPEKTELATVPKTEGGTGEVKPSDTTTLADVLKSNNALLDAINGLRKDLNDGKIAVQMDGALVSTLLARNIEFRGNYGVNK
jgi:hypothetical protein